MIDNVVLLSRPRSGISWLRYICRELCGLEAIHCHKEDSFKDQICKTHHIPKKEISSRPLIVILRNYKECVIRHHCYNHEQKIIEPTELNVQKLLTGDSKVHAKSYVYYLEMYKQWTKPKLLVYYEDLMTTPGIQIQYIGDFLEVDQKNIDNFLLRYEYHVTRSKSLYTDIKSSGDKLKFHSQQLPTEKLRQWDQILKDYNQELYDEYLSRYEEKDE